MKTLLQKLKPEFKDKLNIESEKYPNAINAAIKEMNENNSFLDLKYGTVQVLAMYLDLKSTNITEIINLFES